MFIVCAGRSRSGSTLLYNIVRLILLEIFDKSKVYSSLIKYYKKDKIKENTVVKVHGHDKDLWIKADHVFSCQRNIDDQKKSIVKVRKKVKNEVLSDKDLADFIKYDYARYKKWSVHKNFLKTFDFYVLVNNKEEVVKEICEALRLNIKETTVKSIIDKVNKIKTPNNGIDEETGLLFCHITSNLQKNKT